MTGRGRLPWSTLAAAGGLLAIGLSAIGRGDLLYGGTPLAGRQATFAIVGLFVAAAAAAVPYRRLRAAAGPLYGLSVVGLLAAFAGPARGGAHRWIPLGPVDVQPSEVAKLAFILTLASYLANAGRLRSVRGLFGPAVLTAVPVLLIVREPDLGTSLLFFPMAAAMLLAAGARGRHLAAAAALGLAMLPVLWLAMSAEQRSRVTALTTQADGGEAPRGDGYHLHQSKQVLALAGPGGSELGTPIVEDPAAYRLPAARTDFVFCLIGERWGLAGTLGTLGLQALLALSVLATGYRTRDAFGRLTCVGVATLLASQATINTSMTVGLMPITGLTLPLCSYGGSSLVAVAASLGLSASVSLRPGYDVADTTFRWQRPEARLAA